MKSDTRSMLIIACSQRKSLESGFLPAIERYDGGSYRLLRKAKREGYLPERLDILILSAKYGLITASTSIATYEQRMTREHASELQAQTVQILQSYAQQYPYQEVYVDLGHDYYLAIGDVNNIFANATIIYAEGKIGERLARLKRWLMVTCETERTIFSLSQK